MHKNGYPMGGLRSESVRAAPAVEEVKTDDAESPDVTVEEVVKAASTEEEVASAEVEEVSAEVEPTLKAAPEKKKAGRPKKAAVASPKDA